MTFFGNNQGVDPLASFLQNFYMKLSVDPQDVGDFYLSDASTTWCGPEIEDRSEATGRQAIQQMVAGFGMDNLRTLVRQIEAHHIAPDKIHAFVRCDMWIGKDHKREAHHIFVVYAPDGVITAIASEILIFVQSFLPIPCHRTTALDPFAPELSDPSLPTPNDVTSLLKRPLTSPAHSSPDPSLGMGQPGAGSLWTSLYNHTSVDENRNIPDEPVPGPVPGLLSQHHIATSPPSSAPPTRPPLLNTYAARLMAGGADSGSPTRLPEQYLRAATSPSAPDSKRVAPSALCQHPPRTPPPSDDYCVLFLQEMPVGVSDATIRSAVRTVLDASAADDSPVIVERAKDPTRNFGFIHLGSTEARDLVLREGVAVNGISLKLDVAKTAKPRIPVKDSFRRNPPLGRPRSNGTDIKSRQ